MHAYDSAQSNPVARDLHVLSRQLGMTAMTLHPCPQQLRGTNECGLFTILNGLLLLHGRDIPPRTDRVSLAALRAVFPDPAEILRLGCSAYKIDAPTTIGWRHQPYATGGTSPVALSHDTTVRSEALDRPTPPTHPAYRHAPYGGARLGSPQPSQLRPGGIANPINVDETLTSSDDHTSVDTAPGPHLDVVGTTPAPAHAVHRVAILGYSAQVQPVQTSTPTVAQQRLSTTATSHGTLTETRLEDTTTRDDALSELTIAEERYANALRVAAHHDGLQGSDLDHLIAMAKAEGTNDVSVLSVVGRRPVHLTRNYLKPIHVGASDSGHYFLLYVDKRGVTYVFNSMPSFRPHESLEAIRTITGSDPSRAIDIGPQGTEECGFCVVNAARELLGATFMLRAPPGHLRARYAPDLVQARLTDLEAARAAVALLASQTLHDEQRPAIIASATPALPAMVDSRFESILKTLTTGQRIRCDFRERTDIDGTSHDILSWTGNVTKPWNRSRRCVEVLWDSGLPCFSGRRRAALPEADLPDPLWEYIALTADVAPDTPSQQIPASLPAAPPALPAPTSPPVCVAPVAPRDSLLPTVRHTSTQPPPHFKDWWLTPHASVRSMLQKAASKANALVCITILPDAGTRHDDDIAITVIGRARVEGSDTLLQITHQRCASCGCFGQADMLDNAKPLLIPMPASHCTYYSARVIDSLPPSECSCQADDALDCETSHGVASADFIRELAPDASLGFSTKDNLRGEVCARWFIHHQKPAFVHTLAWKQLHPSTRAGHIRWLNRLKEMPRRYHTAPLGSAAVQLVLEEARDNHWTSWSTIASALSTIASALRHLPQYTSNTQAIDLSTDVSFASAAKRAQHLARVTKGHTQAEALTVEQYDAALSACKQPAVRLFLILAWAFAGRAGDIRQIRGHDVSLKEPPIGSRQMLSVTFRRGKGAAFWGPYTIATMVDTSTMKALLDHIRERGKIVDLFTDAEQRTLSGFIRQAGGHDLRSIRRGRLQHLANRGASTEELRLLSGHKRTDTLLRYLGWGLFSSDSKSAAERRDVLDLPTSQNPTGGGSEADPLAPAPRKMGKYSGYCGSQGRRTRAPPVPFRTPKSEDLGITHADAANWPLKAKDIATLDWTRVSHALGSSAKSNAALGNHLIPASDWTRIDDALTNIQKWCSDAPLREHSDGRTFDVTEIPHTKISRKDFDVLMGSKKTTPLRPSDVIRGWCNGYLIPQPKRAQRRPVWEPCANRWELADKPEASYPSRRVRRYLRRHKLVMDFDFSQFFDQFPLSIASQEFYVCKYLIDDGSTELVKLTRLPMGVTFAPAIAQTLTDVLIAPLLQIPDIRVFTMIDNVRIAAASTPALKHAVHLFLDRCRAAGVILNEQEDTAGNSIAIDVTDDKALEQWARTPKIFLGELLNPVSGSIKNAPKNLQKLLAAWLRISSAGLPATPQAATSSTSPRTANTSPVTLRHLISVISLIFWMIHTHDVHLSSVHSLLQSYSKLCTRASITGYDSLVEYLDPNLAHTIREWVDKLRVLDDEASPGSPIPVEPAPPNLTDDHYDIVINSDACRLGWAAFVTRRLAGEQYLLKQRWRAGSLTRFDLSTVSEPVALVRALCWVREQPWYTQSLRVLCITDHAALATGQRRWWDQQSGFSLNPYLNEAFRLINEMDAIVCFIDGSLNPADSPSRSSTLGVCGAPLTATMCTGQAHLVPPLAMLDYPLPLASSADGARLGRWSSSTITMPKMMG
ncbi:TATE DNA transposon, putative [Bodo saltans]|uniref:TATE DNA transposon, putative n=1 Tax=Bodo saltans TaxID=75058 RepID=A0A0S4IU24_BODSA|nr:TATE DNA transposon, putative [Bodo saltans]|eukprot:CUF29851.1 TATE DNA transposon, putative [Bodo saltans]